MALWWTRSKQLARCPRHLALARSVMSISEKQLQQVVHAALSTAAQQWQEAAAQMQLEIGILRTQVQDAQAVQPPRDATTSLVDTTARETRVLRRRRRLEGLEHGRVCSAPLGLLSERTRRSAGPVLNATLTQPMASCSTQLYYMLVMLCKRTALSRVVNAGLQEGLEAWGALVLHHEPTSLTRSAGLLQELLNFSFEGEIGAHGAVRPRHRPLRESERREIPKQHPHRSCLAHDVGRTVEAVPCLG